MTAARTGLERLLGGAKRKRTRRRGFTASWRPQAHTQALLTKVQAVLDEYAEHLPLTIRQIYYRLIGAHDYPKDERAAERLYNTLGKARRARVIRMEDIRDDGINISRPDEWDSMEEFLAYVRHQASHLQLKRQAGQPINLIIMCEAAGMVPQLERVAHQYGIPVIPSGGFDSITGQHQLAENCTAGVTEVLHIGDHDPDGVWIVLSLAENVIAFVQAMLGGKVTFTRLAVTPPQIKKYRLPTAPPKLSNKRAFSGQTCQAEALPPDVLAQIVEEAILQRLDMRQYKRVRREEKKAQKLLMSRLGVA